MKVWIFFALLSSAAAANLWFDAVNTLVEDVDKHGSSVDNIYRFLDARSSDAIQPEEFHVLPFKDTTMELKGGLVVGQFNYTLSTICLDDPPNDGLGRYCDAGDSIEAVPAEKYFQGSDLDQLPTLNQNGEEFYPTESCGTKERLAVICSKKAQTKYYVGTYNAETGDINSKEGIVIVSAITDDNFDPEAMEHGPVYYSKASSADKEMICNSLGFSGVEFADMIPGSVEYEEFNVVFHRYTAAFKVWELNCPTAATSPADCNIVLAAIEDGDIEDTLFISCRADEPTRFTTQVPTRFTTPGPEPRTDTNNEVDLEFGGMNLKLQVGPYHFRERF